MNNIPYSLIFAVMAIVAGAALFVYNAVQERVYQNENITGSDSIKLYFGICACIFVAMVVMGV